MNYEHLAAIFKCGYQCQCVVDGKQLVSDGHFLAVVPGDFPVGKAKPQPKIEERWREAVSPAPVEVGGFFTYSGMTIRRIGDWYAQAKYAAIFGENATWTQFKSAGRTPCYCVHNADGELLGLVMPVIPRNDGELAPQECKPLTDAEIFGALSCEENGWYMLNNARLKKEIKEARERVTEAEIALEEAEDGLEEAKEELERLLKLRGKVAA